MKSILSRSEDETGWYRQGHVHFILDNLIAAGKAKPMIVVITKAGVRDVHFEPPRTAHEWLTWRRTLNDFAPRLFR